MREELLPDDGRRHFAMRLTAVPPVTARSVRRRIDHVFAHRPLLRVGGNRVDRSRTRPGVGRVVQVLPRTVRPITASRSFTFGNELLLSPARVVSRLVDRVLPSCTGSVRSTRDELPRRPPFLIAFTTTADSSCGSSVPVSWPIAGTWPRLRSIAERSPSRSLPVPHERGVYGVTY